MASLDPKRSDPPAADAAPARAVRVPLDVAPGRVSPLARLLSLAGAVASAAWLALASWYLAAEMGWAAFAQMLPHEQALIVIGIASPVAALWLAIAFVAVPVLIATGMRVRRSMRDRARSAAASLGVSGLTATPGLVLNRAGVVLLGLGWFRWIGVALVSVAALLQVAGISSATAVKFAGRLAEVDTAIDTRH